MKVKTASALYGMEYLEHDGGKRSVGTAGFFFNILAASMVLVVVARNAVVFLLAWEAMTLASFFLVTFEHENKSVRDAGLTYLIATHLGTACLLALFVLLGQGTGILDFHLFTVTAPVTGTVLPAAVFLLAVAGFGTKAGIMPFHVWLPEAHPAAPSHVSALMSGVMIKTGIYGLVRVLTFLGAPPLWWGELLIAIGVTSGILGVLFALAQHDLKRLLAYHSIENIGIIFLGIGLGILGMSIGSPLLTVLGWAGGLLHVVNHAFFKGLLFLGAGVVAQATGTREIDRLGGLLKRMPVTGGCFLVGAAAICGLPGLNGFVSEFLIYLGAFHGIFKGAPVLLAALGVITALAMIGALAAACFTKAFGVVFLGEGRSFAVLSAKEPGWAMRVPMLVLSVACVALGLLAPLTAMVVSRVLPLVTGMPDAMTTANLSAGTGPLFGIMAVVLIMLGLGGIWLVLRRGLLRGRLVETAGTWDCGYALPSARMQYTASSFVQPLTRSFDTILQTRRDFARLEGFFPRVSRFMTETPDVFREKFYQPVFDRVYRGALCLRWVQQGRLQIYILYIIVTLLFLLVWKFW